jgi:hypothetical protein
MKKYYNSYVPCSDTNDEILVKLNNTHNTKKFTTETQTLLLVISIPIGQVESPILKIPIGWYFSPLVFSLIGQFQIDPKSETIKI